MRLPVKPKSLRLAFAAIALTVLPVMAHAGAWLQPKGEGLLILSGTMLSSGRAFDESGGSFDIPRYNKFELDGWLEYGLTDHFTAILGRSSARSASRDRPTPAMPASAMPASARGSACGRARVPSFRSSRSCAFPAAATK